jgi:hypothetical protein
MRDRWLLYRFGQTQSTRGTSILISQLRIYTINRGQMDSWLKAFDGLKPLMAEHGIQVDGTWVDEENERFIWVRSFEDQADLERKEAAFYGSEKWLAGVDHVRGHLAHRDVTVISPV